MRTIAIEFKANCLNLWKGKKIWKKIKQKD